VIPTVKTRKAKAEEDFFWETSEQLRGGSRHSNGYHAEPPENGKKLKE